MTSSRESDRTDATTDRVGGGGAPLPAACWISLLVLAGLIWLRLITWEQYGLSWDEPFRWEDGRQELLYFQELFAGERSIGEGVREDDAYPPLFDLVVAASVAWTEMNPLQAGHMWSNLLGLSAVVAVWLTAWRIAGPWAGLAAALCLLFTPRFYGHIGFNPKDIPFAAGYAWMVYWLVDASLRLPRIPWWSVLMLGSSIGLSTAFRTPGLIGIAFVAVLFGGKWFRGFVRSGSRGAVASEPDVRRDLARFAAIVGISFAIMLALWPAMHGNPWHLFNSASAASSFSWNAPVLYLGQSTAAADLPWHYLPVWLLISLPEPLLILILVGPLPGILLFLHRRRTAPGKHLNLAVLCTPHSLLILALCLPVCYAVIGDAVMYDGLRQMLFVHVPLAVLTGLAWNRLCRYLRSESRHVLSLAISAALLVGLAGVGWRMARLYPYEYTFFNTLVGGLAGAHGRFETEYWATSYKEAVQRIEASLDRESENHPPYRIDVFKAYTSASVFVRQPNFIDAGSVAQGKADFYVVTTRTNYHQSTNLPVSARRDDLDVERDGVPLCIVYDLRR